MANVRSDHRHTEGMCYVCGHYGTLHVEDRPNLWPKVAELIEAAGLQIDRVAQVTAKAGMVTFTVLLTNDEGDRYIVGDGAATAELLFPTSVPLNREVP